MVKQIRFRIPSALLIGLILLSLQVSCWADAQRLTVGSPVPVSMPPFQKPRAAVCFFKFGCAPCEQFLDHIALLSRKYEASVEWLVVTKEDPVKLDAALKTRDARVKVLHDKTSVLFDGFRVRDVPMIFLSKGREIVYKHTGYIPAFENRLATILALFSQDRQIPESYQTRELVVGNRAPDVALPDVSGRMWNSSKYHQRSGHSRLLYLFTVMGCDPCRQATEFLASNAKTLRSTEVVLVSFGPREVTAKEVERGKIPFTVLCDMSFETYMRYGIRGLPTFVLVKDGTITYVAGGWGPGQEEELLQAIGAITYDTHGSKGK